MARTNLADQIRGYNDTACVSGQFRYVPQWQCRPRRAHSSLRVMTVLNSLILRRARQGRDRGSSRYSGGQWFSYWTFLDPRKNRGMPASSWEFGVPYGSRTRVAAVKEKRPIVIQWNLAAWMALYRIW